MKHGKPNFECKCGKEFPTKKQRDIHAFNMEAQEFIENNFGNPFADYHRSIMRDMGGIASYTAAKEEDIPTELTEENVKQAALAFCQGALVAPNSDMLLEYTE